MKRTTIYLEPELEIRLKLEALRHSKPMSEVIREALRAHLDRQPKKELPPGMGAFDSGHRDTASRAEELLNELGFEDDGS